MKTGRGNGARIVAKCVIPVRAGILKVLAPRPLISPMIVGFDPCIRKDNGASIRHPDKEFDSRRCVTQCFLAIVAR